MHNFKADAPKRSALRIAKLKHAGDWNVAPQAIPNLMDALRKPPYQLRRRHHSEGPVSPRSQPGLLPAHLHPRPGGLVGSTRKTSTRCAGTSSPAAERSSPTPPAAARPSTRLFAASSPSCFPTTRWSPIPRDDELYTARSVPTSRTSSTPRGPAAAAISRSSKGSRSTTTGSIIYSKYDIGCALERHTGIECKGYTYESAIKIAGNIVIYSTLP